MSAALRLAPILDKEGSVRLDKWRFKPRLVSAEDRAKFTDEQLRLAQQIAEELWYGMDL